jgi:hypothetical protein
VSKRLRRSRIGVRESEAFLDERIHCVRIVAGRIDLAPHVSVTERSFDVTVGSANFQNVPPVDHAHSQSDGLRGGFEQLRASRGRTADQ